MTTQTYVGTLHVLQCCTCGITHAHTQGFDAARRNDGKTFYCPDGHPQCYNGGKTAEQKLRDDLAAEQRRATRLLASIDQAQADADAERRSRRAVQGHLTRARKRAANGVCPCCSRTFADVQRHLAAKHPEHVERVNADT